VSDAIHGRLRRPATLILATILAVVLGASAALAAGPAIHTRTPRFAAQMTNIDVLRQQIRNYYGDPLGTGTFPSDGNYAREARSVAAHGIRYLKIHRHHHGGGIPAVVFDVDDTTLATWNYEIFSNWAYNPATNGQFVTDQKFPAVPGMVRLAQKAAKLGYAVIFLTGRPATQEAATLGNLTSDGIGEDAGYPSPTTLNDGEDGLFTKPAVVDYPDYLKTACAAEIADGKSCTTIHYKSATRAHIGSLGYDIVANFGDQFSDLKGGSADRVFKMPNPNYFLP
jgi:hypothetical protein